MNVPLDKDDLELLVCAFDCEQGLPEKVFAVVGGLVLAMFGRPGYRAFSSRVDAIDGQYYTKCPGSEVWNQIILTQ